MGMYDYVIFKCPSCGKEIAEQSKSGVCMLRNYSQHKVPVEVAIGLDDETYCSNCKAKLKIVNTTPRFANLKLLEI